MNNPQKAKNSNYMEQTLKEMKELLGGVETIDEIESAMAHLLEKKIKESFKNGIEVGRNKAGKPAGRQFRQNGYDRNRPYRSR